VTAEAERKEAAVSRFIEIQHDEWIAASPDIVRAHYADLHHRADARVHPRERLRLLRPGPTGPRYERLSHGLLRTHHDIFEREQKADGSVVDIVTSGSNWGRSVRVRFWRRPEHGRPGTLVELTVTQPLPPLIGRLLARWMRRRLEHELREMAAEDRADIERGYQPGRVLRAA
jgi:hypothetical protein